jgi:general secretion pathway protein B
MSYILDALKKSEKERQRGTLPDMLTVQDIVAERPGRRYVWVYFLLAALFLNAGIFAWWLGFSHTEKTKAVQPSIAEHASPPVPVKDAAEAVPDRDKPTAVSPEATSPELRPVAKKILPVNENAVSANSDGNSVRSEGVQEVSDVQRKILPDRPVSVSSAIKPSKPSPEKVKQAEGADRLPTGPTGGLVEMPDENKIYKLKELPSSIRQNLPSFSISALMYSSNPASRMVRINDQMMYEGQDLTAEVKLEEIARDGLIFRYHKYRFYVGVK